LAARNDVTGRGDALPLATDGHVIIDRVAAAAAAAAVAAAAAAAGALSSTTSHLLLTKDLITAHQLSRTERVLSLVAQKWSWSHQCSFSLRS